MTRGGLQAAQRDDVRVAINEVLAPVDQQIGWSAAS
jgi:hypothetical protein